MEIKRLFEENSAKFYAEGDELFGDGANDMVFGDGDRDMLLGDGYDSSYEAAGPRGVRFGNPYMAASMRNPFASSQIINHVTYRFVINNTNAANIALVEFLGFDALGTTPVILDANTLAPLTGVTVASGTPGVTYGQMVRDFAARPLSIGRIKLSSDLYLNIAQIGKVVARDASGMVSERVLGFEDAISPYQLNTKTVELNVTEKIDGRTSLVLTVQPNSQLSVILFAIGKVDVSNPLFGRNTVVRPPLTGVGAAPVNAIGGVR